MGNYIAPYIFDDNKTVLSDKYSGGPHGLGDPEDKSLRKAERDVLIQRIINETARNEYCRKEMLDVIDCSKDKGLSLVWNCKQFARALEACLERASKDVFLREKCTEQYLERRSEFRRTGIKVRNPTKYGPKVNIPREDHQPVVNEQTL